MKWPHFAIGIFPIPKAIKRGADVLPELPQLPPEKQEMVVCAIGAGLSYDVPVNIVLAIAEQEAGKPGQWVKNSNGTYDVGAMQFNTAYLTELKRYGITAEAVSQPGCYSYQLAAWRLHGHLKNDKGDVWTRAANYHSRTPQYNLRYRAQLMRRAHKWHQWLEGQFLTHEVDKETADLSRPTCPSDPFCGVTQTILTRLENKK